MGVGASNVCVREPGVERHGRHFDGKSDEQQNEGRDLQRRAERMGAHQPLADLLQLDDVECPHVAAAEVEHQDRDQHQDTSHQRVEEELDGRVFLSRSAPDADQEVHRQQHDFPKDVEQEEVQSQKDSEHPCLEDQEQNQVALHLLVHAPGGEHCQHRDKAGQQHQRHADSVIAELVVDVPRPDPRHLDAVLVPVDGQNSGLVLGRPELLEQEDREHERRQRDAQREDPHRLDVFFVEAQRDDQGAHGR